VIGAPFFDSLTLQLPHTQRTIRVTAHGASSGKRYVKGVTMDGEPWDSIFISHARLLDGADIVFEMATTPQVWGV
jgi:putative alpha-1,2-mannosidase